MILHRKTKIIFFFPCQRPRRNSLPRPRCGPHKRPARHSVSAQMGSRRSVPRTSPRRPFPIFFRFRFEYELKRHYIYTVGPQSAPRRPRIRRTGFSADGVETPGNRQACGFFLGATGEIGKRTGFRSQHREVCGFESRVAHHLS